MTDFVPAERATVIRLPSTALFPVNSADRYANPGQRRNQTVVGSPYDFYINRGNSLLNGFFTRIAVTEITFPWTLQNVTGLLNTNTLVVDVSGVGVQTILVLSGFYNMNELSIRLQNSLNANAVIGSGSPAAITWTVKAQQSILQPTWPPLSNGAGWWGFKISAAAATQPYFKVLPNPTISDDWVQLYDMMGFSLAYTNTYRTAQGSSAAPDLQPIKYVDIVSEQLTYNQSLKDSSTSVLARDTLCRVYLTPETGIMPYSWNNPSYDLSGTEAYNFGARPFIVHRQFSMPKQIRWSAQQPIGQIHFTVYMDNGQVLPNPYGSSATSQEEDWSMTLQVSEV